MWRGANELAPFGAPPPFYLEANIFVVVVCKPRTLNAPRERDSFPSPLAGEGAERAWASEAGEGVARRQRLIKYPSPGTSLATARNVPPSPARGEGR